MGEHLKFKRHCKFCNKEFHARSNQIKRGEGEFCSLSCSSKYNHNANPRNYENNPNWKGGVSKQAIRYTKKYKENNPNKIKTHRLLATEIRAGRIKREACEICGNSKTDAHHDDYFKPLNVRWLCRKHHIELHKQM